MINQQDIFRQINNLDPATQQAIFQMLRERHQIHPLEQRWNIPAEFILEAISRSQDITQRGVRGIIAELCFTHYVLQPLAAHGWREVAIFGDQPYDSLIEKGGVGQIKIQTKNQRLERGAPKYAGPKMARSYPHTEGWYICETQKTRTGTDSDGNATRPYRFGEFDILSVCLHPSTGDWSRFIFCPAHTLIPSDRDPQLIATFQPVPSGPVGNWTMNLEEAIEWHLNRRTHDYSGQFGGLF
ncbi:hypothetical protein [Burkholderia cepacia]|uniref:hypothetical protein n=1 Tax=Burkholderia cepacia TaxID=292 RepID=UPI0009C00299|nr:hypothetical protein [Burkholderia cepacia]